MERSAAWEEKSFGIVRDLGAIQYFFRRTHYENEEPSTKSVLIGSIVLAICIYGLFLNRLSETEMVRWSYVWFPGLLFGAVGLKAGQTSLRLPIIVTVIGMVALFVFFEMIFPAL